MNLFKNFNWNFWEKKNAPSEHNINIQYDSLSSFFQTNVGKQAYLFSVVANSAIEIIVKAIINIPLETQIANNEGKKEIRTDLDISPLLTKVNPRDTFESLLESLAIIICFMGILTCRLFMAHKETFKSFTAYLRIK